MASGIFAFLRLVLEDLLDLPKSRREWIYTLTAVAVVVIAMIAVTLVFESSNDGESLQDAFLTSPALFKIGSIAAMILIVIGIWLLLTHRNKRDSNTKPD